VSVAGLLLAAALALVPGPQAASRAPQPASAARDRALELAAAEAQAGRRAEAKSMLAAAAERFASVRALMLLARLQSEDGDAAGMSPACMSATPNR